MIANVDVGFLFVYVFCAYDLVRYEIEFAESPGPKFQEFKTNGCSLVPKNKWDKDTWKVEQHEY